jgi:hypothetical protein
MTKSNIPSSSIANIVDQDAWNRLSESTKRRFSQPDIPVIYRGSLTIYRSFLGVLLSSLISPFGLALPKFSGRDIIADVLTYPDGKHGVVWECQTRHAGITKSVRSTKRINNARQVEIRTDRGLVMVMEVLEDNSSLLFKSLYYYFELWPRGWRFNIPYLLTPGQCIVEHYATGDKMFQYKMKIHHKLWGLIFHQTGYFTEILAGRCKTLVFPSVD